MKRRIKYPHITSNEYMKKCMYLVLAAFMLGACSSNDQEVSVNVRISGKDRVITSTAFADSIKVDTSVGFKIHDLSGNFGNLNIIMQINAKEIKDSCFRTDQDNTFSEDDKILLLLLGILIIGVLLFSYT